MACASRAVTVGTTATRLDQALSNNDPSAGLAVYNNGAVTMYLGGPDVTAAEGYPLAAGQHLAADVGRVDKLYARTASGSTEARVLQVSV